MMSAVLAVVRVSSGLYLSGMHGVNIVDALECHGITHVLNVARELSDLAYPIPVETRHVALRDAETEHLLPWLPDLVEHVHNVISTGGRICVHCVAGISRSASVCIAYLIRYEGLSLRQAYQQVLNARPVISPNLAFWKALVDYEWQIRSSNSVVLMPFICGMIPELEPYQRYAEMRINLGWMQELLVVWSLHLTLLVIQILATVFGHTDNTRLV
nr:hypothetical protein BaRGS_018818 [Batillaria attramentaria]